MERLRKIMGKVPAGLLTGITLAVILWLTLAPHPTGDMEIPLFPGADKVVHAIMFGFLTLVALLETMKRRGWSPLPLPLIGAISFASAIIGIVIEIVQRAMGLGREFEVLDIMADAAGAVVAGAVWAALQNTLAKPED